MSARLPGYYIFKSVFTLFNFIVCTNFDRRLFFASLKINTGFYLPKSKAFNISFPRRFIEPDFRRSLSFSMQSRLISGLIVWPSTRKIVPANTSLFFSLHYFFSFVKGNFNYCRHRVYICFLVSWYYWNNLSLGVSLFTIQLWNSWRLMVLCTSGLSVWPFF